MPMSFGFLKRLRIPEFAQSRSLGADAASPSPYIRNRGEGETAVQAAFPSAVVVR